MQIQIDGEWVGVADGRVGEIREATGELIVTAPHGGVLDATRGIEAAQRGRHAMANTLQPGCAALSLPLVCRRRSSTRPVKRRWS